MTNNPIVLDMTEEQVKSVWQSCRQCQEALTESNGEDWGAAAGSDPGVTSCPYCNTSHWTIGKIHQCTNCKGIYPVDWWSMYSYGVGSSGRERTREGLKKLHNKRIAHPAYRHGYKNPVDNAWAERMKQPWIEIFAADFSSKELALLWLDKITELRKSKPLSKDMEKMIEFIGQAVATIKAKHPKREDAQGIIVCPKCGGNLHYYIAKLNRHVHGQCKTTGCLQWMM